MGVALFVDGHVDQFKELNESMFQFPGDTAGYYRNGQYVPLEYGINKTPSAVFDKPLPDNKKKKDKKKSKKKSKKK